MSVAVRTRQVRVYYVLVLATTWGIGGLGVVLPRWFPGFPPYSSYSPIQYLAVYSASLLGLFLTACYEGREGLKRMMARLIPWRAGLHWYLIILAGYPAVIWLAGEIGGLFGAEKGNVPDWGRFFWLVLPAVATDPGPLGEEFGWRGFALPRMLEFWSPLPATLILGAVWGLLHLPAFFIPELPQSQHRFAAFMLGTWSLCIVQTWIHLRTNGSLPPIMLAHLMANYCGLRMGVPYGFFIAAEVACAAAILMAGGLNANGPGRQLH
jgi:hypothetical protein